MRSADVIGAFVVFLELAGTFVFALSGAITAIRHRLDFFGVLALAFAAANFGGVTRDVLIGAVPPIAIVDWRYLAVSSLAGIVAFLWHRPMERLRHPVLLFDAIGLALFSVVGTTKALAFHLGPGAAVMLGVVTGIGGGLVRDLLVSEVPVVFRAEIYAVAALLGAIVVVAGDALHLPAGAVAVVAAGLCVTIRMLSIVRGWRLPHAEP